MHPMEERRTRLVRAAHHYSARITHAEFFSHVTAAALWGLPIAVVDQRIDVSVLAPRRGPRARGVRGHQLSPKQVAVTTHPEIGAAVTTPASTWAQIGGVVRHPYDLTALADAIIRTPRIPGPRGRVLASPLASIDELMDELDSGRRVGIDVLRSSLHAARVGSSSRMETWTRLTIIDGGLPEPVLDHDVYDDRGVFIGCVDLAYPDAKVAIEYEGDHHRTSPAQWNRDIEKHDALVRAGWRVIRVTREHVVSRPGVLCARVREALRAA
ncbi:DUF559 domain-containing protein [Microbacterium koreense]